MNAFKDTLIELVERNAVFFHAWGIVLIISGFILLLALIYLVNTALSSFRTGLILTIFLIFPLIFLTALTFLLTSPLNSYISTLATLENSIGKPAPGSEFINLRDNTVHHLNDFHGKVVILNYWGVNCVKCEHELTALKALEDSATDNLAVISISHDPVNLVRQYIQVHVTPSYTGISPGNPWIDPGTHLPFIILIDRQGIIRGYFYGKDNIQEVKQLIDKSLL